MKLGVMVAVGLALLAGLGWAWWSGSSPQPAMAAAPTERHYIATGQVLGVKALGKDGCEVKVKLHQWLNISEGFSLAEIPKKGQIYAISANPDQCLALEVALATQGNPNDLKSPRHINYKAQQRNQGAWYLTENPTAPTGCGGL